jgi:hypothetical protein
MRNRSTTITLGAIFLLALAAGCKKDKGHTCNTRENNNKDTTSIAGTWELEVSGGGLSGQTVHYPACNGTRWIFKPDNTYRQLDSWKLVREGKYVVVRDAMAGGEMGNRLILDNDTGSIRQFVTNDGTRLGFGLDRIVADGGHSAYIRRIEDLQE